MANSSLTSISTIVFFYLGAKRSLTFKWILKMCSTLVPPISNHQVHKLTKVSAVYHFESISRSIFDPFNKLIGGLRVVYGCDLTVINYRCHSQWRFDGKLLMKCHWAMQNLLLYLPLPTTKQQSDIIITNEVYLRSHYYMPKNIDVSPWSLQRLWCQGKISDVL
jgi:hypothetical protein